MSTLKADKPALARDPWSYQWFAGCESLPRLLLQCTDFWAGPGRRYDLSHPWIEGEHVYASDGRILARCSASVLSDAARDFLAQSERKVPRAAETFVEPVYPDEPVKAPRVESPYRDCEDCCGKGHESTRRCCVCGGIGSLLHNKGETCPTCHGHGRYASPCETCEGDGWVWGENWDQRNPVGIASLATQYIYLLQHHECLIYVTADPLALVKFVSGGVEGRLMPLKPVSENTR